MNNKDNKLGSANINEMFANLDQGPPQQKKRKKPGAVSTKELELALTVLLVDLASCDQNFEPAEYQTIASGLKRIFGTCKEQVKPLVNQANMIIANLRGTSRFAAMLRENLDDEEKIAVMETIDDLIGADGVEDGFETYLRTKFADLLGMPTELPAGKS